MIFNVRSVRLGVKSEMYGRVVALTMSYAAEKGGMRTDEIQKLDVMEVKCSRNMC